MTATVYKVGDSVSYRNAGEKKEQTGTIEKIDITGKIAKLTNGDLVRVEALIKWADDAH